MDLRRDVSDNHVIGRITIELDGEYTDVTRILQTFIDALKDTGGLLATGLAFGRVVFVFFTYNMIDNFLVKQFFNG